MKHTIAMLSVLGMTLGISATALGACWDKLDELQAQLQSSRLTDEDRASVQRALHEAELTRSTNDTAHCEELVTQAQEQLGMKGGASEDSMPEAGDRSPDDRTANSSPRAAGNAEVPARYETGATDIEHMTSDDLLGRNVLAQSGEQIGEIEAIVRDADTPPRGYAVVAVDDESGVGQRRILIGLDLIRVEPDGSVRTSAQTSQELANYPEYVRDEYQIYEGGIAELQQTGQ